MHLRARRKAGREKVDECEMSVTLMPLSAWVDALNGRMEREREREKHERRGKKKK